MLPLATSSPHWIALGFREVPADTGELVWCRLGQHDRPVRVVPGGEYRETVPKQVAPAGFEYPSTIEQQRHKSAEVVVVAVWKLEEGKAEKP